MKTRYLTALVFLYMGFYPYAFAQSAPPYLISATLYIAVDDWADVWLNGFPIVYSQPYTPELKSYKTFVCLPKHLCYFKEENILAIENTNAYHIPPPHDDRAGIAYELKLRFSDGTEQTLSSNDLSEHRAYYIPGREMGEPMGWHLATFDDQGWEKANGTGLRIPGVASLSDPETGQPVQFLSAAGDTSQARYPGERHLYRRKFSLRISPNPLCESGGLRQKEIGTIRKTSQPLQPAKTLIPAPKNMVAPTPTWTHQPLAAPLVHLKYNAPVPGVALPTRKIESPLLSPTPVIMMNVITLPTTIPKPVNTETPTLFSTPATESISQPAASEGQTVVFGESPANIYISFADGPGNYRLEVLDLSMGHLRNLFEKGSSGRMGIGWNGTGRTTTARMFRRVNISSSTQKTAVNSTGLLS